MNRRTFIGISAITATGWLLAELLPVKEMAKDLFSSEPANFTPHPLIRLQEDGKIFLYVMKQEMGQSVNTSLPLILAEELEADPKDVEVEILPYNPGMANDYNTWGSSSIQYSWMPLRQAGAAARSMLHAAAAQEWGVAEAECRAENSHIVHIPSGKKVHYKELIKKAAERPVPVEPALKSTKDFKLVGKGQKKTNLKKIVTGKVQYALDVSLPEMLYATVVRCPVYNGKIRSWDDTALKQFDNSLRVVEIKPMGAGVDNRAGLAVVAKNSWLALRGQQLLKVEWDLGPFGNLNSEVLSEQLSQAIGSTPPTEAFNAQGKTESFTAAVNKQAYSAQYELPYLAHAALEPFCCTADYKSGKWELWGGFQAPGLIADILPNAFEIGKEDLFVHLLPMGGAFGRKEKLDTAAEAMQVAKAVGKPVKVFFSRTDDTRNDFYRPASFHQISAVADKNGIQQWTHQQAITSWPDKNFSAVHHGFGGAMGDLYYPIQNYNSAFYSVPSPLPIGSWRSISYHHNVFVIESFMDELARQQGVDPVAFRLKVLEQPVPQGPISDKFNPRRLAAVLQKCADAIAWDTAPTAGNYRGIACCNYTHAQAYAAHAFEISMGQDHKLKIHKAVCVLDCGTVVEPDGLRAQIEGSFVWGLNAALKNEVTIQHGGVQQQSFFDYEVIRMGELPPLEIHIVPSEEAPGGAGETAVPSIAPALCNAIAAATGQRIRRLPLQKAGIRLA